MTNGSENNSNQQGNAVATEALAEIHKLLAGIAQRQDEQDKLNQTVSEQLCVLSTERLARQQRALARREGGGVRLNFDTKINQSLPPPPPRGPNAVAANQAAVCTIQPKQGGGTNSFSSSEDEEIHVEDRDENPIPQENTCRRSAQKRKSQTYRRDDTSAEKEENIRLAQQHKADQLKNEMLEQLKATLSMQDEEMRMVRSQVHKATSKASKIDRMMAESTQTPFTARISGVALADPVNFY